MNERILKQQCL